MDEAVLSGTTILSVRLAMSPPPPADIRRKQNYHHGDLREALIAATRQLLIERGPENFSLSDACRLAGVSSAAPYKHFRDKDHILEEIAERAFEDLEAAIQGAVIAAGGPTQAGIVAMGHAYLHFARAQPAIFRLMFGHKKAVKKAPDVDARGKQCFASVITVVAQFCAAQKVEGRAELMALDLWTFVHGAAELTLAEDYDKVAPGLDVEAMITRVTPRLLGV
jgi:AcrR family transcriptional regulator